MVKSLLAHCASRTLANTASVTRYLSLVGGDTRNPASAATNVQLKAPVAGVFSRLAMRVTANARSTTTTVRFYLAGASGAQALSIAGGATGWFEDTSNTDTAAAGDQFCLQIVTGTGTGAITTSEAQVVFEASSGSKQIWAGDGPGAFNNSTTVIYAGIFGGQNQSTESQVQAHAPDAGTWSNLQVFVESNSLTVSTTTWRSRVNGANGNQSVTVAAGATGWFEDTTNSDSLALGDLIAVSRAGSGGGSGLATINQFQSLWTPTNGKMLIGGGAGLIRTLAASATEYMMPWGQKVKSTTEADVLTRLPYAGTLSALRVRVVSGTFTGSPATVRLRVNSADTAINFSIPTASTGVFEDTVNTVSIAAGDDFCVRTVNSGISGTLYLSAIELAFAEPQTIILVPDAGRIEFRGKTPAVGVVLEPEAGRVVFRGKTPALAFRVALEPEAGRIEFRGLLPELIQTEAKASQAAVLALGDLVPESEVSQAAVLALSQIVPEVYVSQEAALALAEVIPPVRVSSEAVLVLAEREPCTSRAAQLWTITRRDGVVLRFASLDVDFQDGDNTYSACASLLPSASESSTILGQAGDIELTGIISDEAITEADLLAGLFDDAYVEVWLVPWQGSESRRRLAAGWCGNLSRGDTAFKMDVSGPGARLDQQAILEIVTPSCRYNLGDSRCGFDIEAVKLPACAVTASRTRGQFVADFSSSSVGSGSSDPTWENGYVLWTYGANTGQKCEVKSVDFDTGEVVLWSLAGFKPQPGDSFDLYPGCRKDREACVAYGQVLNFGGFPDVPGQDAILESPDAKY